MLKNFTGKMKRNEIPYIMAKFWDCLDMALSYYENPTSFKQEVQNDVNSIGKMV